MEKTSTKKEIYNSVLFVKKRNKIASKISDFLCITFGAVLLSIGVYFFKIPNGFTTGGVSGISTLLGKQLPILSSASWLIVINVSILILGFLLLDKKNGFNTIYCSLLYSLLTKVFEIYFPLSHPLSSQPFLELMYAMFLTALGSAMMFQKSASSGGTDIVALVLKKYTKINVGQSLLCTDFFVAVSSFFVFGINAGLFSLFGLFVKAFMVDAIIDNINSCKYFVIVTSKPNEISEYILDVLHHGMTSNIAIGGYTGNSKTIIHTVCRRVEAINLRSKIFKIDPHAFVIISTTSEIIGRGFRSV